MQTETPARLIMDQYEYGHSPELGDAPAFPAGTPVVEVGPREDAGPYALTYVELPDGRIWQVLVSAIETA